MDYNARMREAKLLMNQGMYTQAVRTLGNVLENIYTDFYNDVLNALPLSQRKILTDREEQFTSKGDKRTKEQGFAGLTLGGKGAFFHKEQIVPEAENLLGRDLPHFKAFDVRLFRDIRNELTHGADAEVSEDEASLFYSQMRVLLLELGYIEKVEAKPIAEVSAGGIRSWKENGVIPHDDILGGNLKMDAYAADLWGVARNDRNTPLVYRDPAQFFQQTYLTNELRNLLDEVLSALSGGQGDHVLQLRTPFGGGKTHTLIALYHLVSNRNHLKSVDHISDLPDPGLCSVAAVQCEKFDVRKGRDTDEGLHIHTLWGEIAYQLGGVEAYDYMRESDQNMTSPGGETIATLLRDLGQPTLILLDEILNHVEAAQTVNVGDSKLGRQIMVFLKNLTESVAATPNAVLVYSLQASIGEALGSENLLATLDHLVSRLDAKREPVSGNEVMRVVQRRLFKDLGDETIARQVAKTYADTYRKTRQAVGGLSGDEQYQAGQDAERLQERIMDSYPFHPDLLDLMYHRWGSLPSYQRTRGALQFLASVVYDLWDAGRDIQPLIGVGDIPFYRPNTRNAFFSQVGQRENYSSVMDADLTGNNARSHKVDRVMASDSPSLQRFRVGTRLASSIMLYSFGARDGEERGVPETDLIQANAVPGLDRMSLTTALNDLRNELLYMHYTGRRYRFETQANLNKLIDEESKKFDGTDIASQIEKSLNKALQGATGAVIWPDQHGRINDHVPMLQVVYLPMTWNELNDDTLLEELDRWLEYAGNSRREYKNAVAFALPSYTVSDSAATTTRDWLAIDSLIRDKARFKFNHEQLIELKTRSKDAQDRLERSILNLYERIAIPVPEEKMYSWRFVELQSRNELKLHDRVMGALYDSRLVFDSLTPGKLVQLTYLYEEEVISVDDIAKAFFSYFSFLRVTSVQALKTAIARGVEARNFGYTVVYQADSDGYHFPNKSMVYFGRSLRPDEIDLNDAIILSDAVAEQVTYVEPIEPSGGSDDDSDDSGGETQPPIIQPPPNPDPDPPVQTKTVYHLRAVVDKHKVFKLFKIIQNLVNISDNIRIELNVRADKADAFDSVWIRNAVEEPLDEADIESGTALE